MRKHVKIGQSVGDRIRARVRTGAWKSIATMDATNHEQGFLDCYSAEKLNRFGGENNEDDDDVGRSRSEVAKLRGKHSLSKRSSDGKSASPRSAAERGSSPSNVRSASAEPASGEKGSERLGRMANAHLGICNPQRVRLDGVVGRSNRAMCNPTASKMSARYEDHRGQENLHLEVDTHKIDHIRRNGLLSWDLNAKVTNEQQKAELLGTAQRRHYGRLKNKDHGY